MRRIRNLSVVILAAAGGVAAVWAVGGKTFRRLAPIRPIVSTRVVEPEQRLTPFQAHVVADLRRQCESKIWYQDGYYTGGEPPAKIGVCTDVVIRSFRAGGIDLQKAVQADIREHPGDYDVARPDANIDHRRCRNLVVFFRRHARQLPVGDDAAWAPGDIVFWDTRSDGKVDHVGVIGNKMVQGNEPSVIHHWPGNYVAETDWLHQLPIMYHFRYAGG